MYIYQLYLVLPHLLVFTLLILFMMKPVYISRGLRLLLLHKSIGSPSRYFFTVLRSFPVIRAISLIDSPLLCRFWIVAINSLRFFQQERGFPPFLNLYQKVLLITEGLIQNTFNCSFEDRNLRIICGHYHTDFLFKHHK